MKKILSAALALSVMTGLLAFSASADTPALVSAEDIAVMSVEQIAYLDLETAAPAVQDAILEARAEIIYGDQAWTVDGAAAIYNTKTGTVTELPEFSDLYPGWDIPERNISMAPTGIPCMTTYSSAAGILIEKSSPYRWPPPLPRARISPVSLVMGILSTSMPSPLRKTPGITLASLMQSGAI